MWPEIHDIHLPFFLLITFLQITEAQNKHLLEFLSLTIDDLIKHAATILLPNTNEHAIQCLLQTQIDFNNETNKKFSQYILENLNQILTATTYKTVNHYNNKQNAKTNEAKFTAFMQKKKIQCATVLTSNVITTATAHINMTNTTAAMNQYKFDQLEKTIHQQQETTNHINNKLRDIERKKQMGGQPGLSTKLVHTTTGPTCSVTWAPPTQFIHKKQPAPNQTHRPPHINKQIKWSPPRQTLPHKTTFNPCKSIKQIRSKEYAKNNNDNTQNALQDGRKLIRKIDLRNNMRKRTNNNYKTSYTLP